MKQQTQLYQRNDDVIARKVNGKMVILDLEKEKIYFLNETAEYLWNELSHKKSISDLATGLASEYGIPQKNACKDVETIIKKYNEILFISCETA